MTPSSKNGPSRCSQPSTHVTRGIYKVQSRRLFRRDRITLGSSSSCRVLYLIRNMPRPPIILPRRKVNKPSRRHYNKIMPAIFPSKRHCPQNRPSCGTERGVLELALPSTSWAKLGISNALSINRPKTANLLTRDVRSGEEASANKHQP